jgi:hypothetical protein
MTIHFSEGQSTSMLRLKVVLPDVWTFSVEARDSDVARTVALSGPPLKQAVFLIHNGRFLHPLASLASQGVTDGDTIVLFGGSAPARGRLGSADDANGVLQETLRLSGLDFVPCEIAGSVYQQMWEDHKAGHIDRHDRDYDDDKPEEDGTDSTAVVPDCGGTVLGPPASEVSERPLRTHGATDQ